MTVLHSRPRHPARWFGLVGVLLWSVLVHGVLLGHLTASLRESAPPPSAPTPLWVVPVQVAPEPQVSPGGAARPSRPGPAQPDMPRRPQPATRASVPPSRFAAPVLAEAPSAAASEEASPAAGGAVMQDVAQGPSPDADDSPGAAEQSHAEASGPTATGAQPAEPTAQISGASEGVTPALAGEGPNLGTVSAQPLPRLPASHAQQFRVYWGDYEGGQSVARVRYRLTVDGDRYALRTEGEAEGLISLVYSGTLTQFSTGLMGAAGLSPERYVESRGRRGERAVDFEGTPRQLRPQGAPALAIAAGTQDRLSVFYQLGLLARADPTLFAAGQTVVIPVASLRDVRLERFLVIGEEVLLAPGGPIRALRLHRTAPFGSRDPRIDLWLGYDHQMLPVRLRVEDGSRRVLDQLLEPGA